MSEKITVYKCPLLREQEEGKKGAIRKDFPNI